MIDYDKWWSSLTTTEKERIATKAARKAGNPDAPVVHYPACTAWWITVDETRKASIYEHCTDAHGLLLPEWKEGKSMSY